MEECAIRGKEVGDNKSIKKVHVFSLSRLSGSLMLLMTWKKIFMFQNVCGTNISTLKKSRRGTLLKFYKVVAVPAFLYGCETWNLTN